MKIKYILSLLLGGFVFAMPFLPLDNNDLQAFHTEAELSLFSTIIHSNNIDTNAYFPSSNSCRGCHGYDPLKVASIDIDSNDINVFDDWKATMMANSAKDPFWRAKVSHEVLINPGHTVDIENKCTSCHAPMGHYTAMFNGDTHYSMMDLLNDTLGLDGVSCGICHQLSATNLGEQFSGEMTLDTFRILHGQYFGPFAAPMDLYVGFLPVYGPHISDAGICAPCHTLVTKTADLDGNYTGNTFVEQATYHEWLNSDYNVQNISCQKCHVPRVEEGVIISANYSFLDYRSPFGKHEFAGANTFMLQLMKENKDALGIDATDANFDSTLHYTYQMLQNQTLDMELNLDAVENDTAYFSVKVTNKAGHKFPSGYPSRRAFIEFIAKDDMGNILFKSGVLQADAEVEGQDPHFEPHYDIIRKEDEVQIYEMVIADVNDQFSTLLERANSSLKDNRLPPLGFSKTHEVYDTTLVVGKADVDPNFNIDENGMEGNASDIVHYHVALNGYEGLADVTAKVYYQSLPPKWMEEMFAESTPEIDAFKAMYNDADQTPVLVSSDALEGASMISTSIREMVLSENKINIFPNPMGGESVLRIEVENDMKIYEIELFNQDGKLIGVFYNTNKIDIIESGNLYYIKILTSEGVSMKKVLRF